MFMHSKNFKRNLKRLSPKRKQADGIINGFDGAFYL